MSLIYRLNHFPLEAEIVQYGLEVMAVVQIEAKDSSAIDIDSTMPEQTPYVALIGGAKSKRIFAVDTESSESSETSLWQRFKTSSEYADGYADPLDRWSRSIGQQLANAHGLKVVFPFEGPPYFPFVSWADRAPNIAASKMGPSLHKDYGLWMSYRFALLLPSPMVEQAEGLSDEQFGCAVCDTKPCFSTCPVDAYSEAGFNRRACFTYLDENQHSDCVQRGCLARRACPVGQSAQYGNQQAQFHMQSFITSSKKLYSSI